MMVLEARIDHLLESSFRGMGNKGFVDGPPYYKAPTLYLQKNAAGNLTSDRFYLSWTSMTHSLLFYTCWNNYHWQSNTGSQTYVLQLRHNQWKLLEDIPHVKQARPHSSRMNPTLFADYLQRVLTHMPAIGLEPLQLAP